jgi:hypothetical protein
MRSCTDCGETKPIDCFVRRLDGQPNAVYPRCRVCRNRRARERYHSTPEVRAAEIARSLKNKRLRAQRRRGRRAQGDERS